MKPLLYIVLSFLLLAPVGVFAAEQVVNFVPLSDVDAIKFTGQSDGLPNLLNSLYRIAIGAAAIIGVLQLMHAGLKWMTAGGSHESIGAAKGIIRDTILGLILVLAPTIVFSIINPDILDLRIDGLSGLGRDPAPSVHNILWFQPVATSGSLAFDVKKATDQCSAQGGQPVLTCSPPGATDWTAATPTTIDKSCHDGKGTYGVACVRTGSTPADPAVCSDYDPAVAPICDASKGYTLIDNTCCDSRSVGFVCCGKKKVVTPPASATKYGWRASLTKADGSGRSTHSLGPFDTQKICEDSIGTYMQSKQLVSGDPFQCDCNKPLGQQPNCNIGS